MVAWYALPVVGLVAALAAHGLAASAQKAATPAFIPQHFFIGSTVGDGTFKALLAPLRRMHVTGSGRLLYDRTMVLTQTVAIETKPTRQREWRLRELSPGHYGGTLSDANGPVTGDVVDGRLHLQYAMAGSAVADQWLTLDAGGRSAQNLMTITKSGVRVATIEETIRR